MLSFWEKQSYLQYNYVVIGAGITGLSTGISIKEQDANATVAVIERGVLPTGASTKNAGFACFGSLTELLSDISAMGEDEMLKLVEARWKGLELLRSRLGDDAIDLQVKGGYELISQENESCVDQIEYVNALLESHFPSGVFVLRDDLIDKFGFNSTRTQHLIFNPFEGQIDTGRMMRSLQAKAQKLGIDILVNTMVEELGEGQVEIKGNDGTSLTVKTDQVAVCTNAFTKSLLPEIKLNPGRGIVLVTKPLENLPFEGTFHMNEGYDYFRDYYGRLIYGGCRDIAMEKETTDQFGVNDTILEELKHRLEEVILGHNEFEIDHVWSGIMAFGQDKRPVVSRIDPYTVAGVRLGGMGVALGSLIGQQLADLLFVDQ
ncbi:MAG: FAD-binding oxidoreductase [Bacteroidota bacterium]